MQLASDPAPLGLLHPKQLAAPTASLALQSNELRYVVDADQNVAGFMKGESDEDDGEIVTGERPCPS